LDACIWNASIRASVKIAKPNGCWHKCPVLHARNVDAKSFWMADLFALQRRWMLHAIDARNNKFYFPVFVHIRVTPYFFSVLIFMQSPRDAKGIWPFSFCVGDQPRHFAPSRQAYRRHLQLVHHMDIERVQHGRERVDRYVQL
jgi:hypothetical protein